MKAEQKVRLSDVCGISSMLIDPRRTQYLQMPHVGGANIESMTGKLLDLKTAEQEGLKSAKFLFDEQMVLYSKIRPYLMKVARPDFRGLCSADIYPLSPSDGRLNRNFLFHLLLTPTFTDYAITGSARAGMPKVNRDHLFAFVFHLPSLAEQQRIVGILDEAFDGIATAKANAEKNLQNANALFESHLQGMDAEKASLGNLVKIKTGKLDANAAVEGGQYPFFTCSREVYAIDKYDFDCEAILLAGNNAVGDFNVKHYKGKFNAYQRTYVITVNEKNRVLYRFLYFQMLKSLKKFKAQSVGAGTKFLKLRMITDLEIALPSVTDQQRMVSTMDSIREETQRLESLYQRKLAALDELKKSLLHQAFSGQL